MTLPASQPAKVPFATGEADAHHVEVGSVERVGHLVNPQHALLGRGQGPAGLDPAPHRGQWVHQHVLGPVLGGELAELPVLDVLGQGVGSAQKALQQA